MNERELKEMVARSQTVLTQGNFNPAAGGGGGVLSYAAPQTTPSPINAELTVLTKVIDEAHEELSAIIGKLTSVISEEPEKLTGACQPVAPPTCDLESLIRIKTAAVHALVERLSKLKRELRIW